MSPNPFSGSVYGDRDRIYQVSMNLLKNAERFSTAPNPISVAVEQDHECWTLSVTDHGEGMGDAEQQNIFKSFYQGAKSRNGLGLGLFLAAEIVRQHGGALTVKSALGVGSTFAARMLIDARGLQDEE
jgi:signal transduction histidine kinase